MGDPEPGPLDLAPGKLDDRGFYATRRIDDGEMAGRWLALEPMTFARVRLGLSVQQHKTDPDIAFGFGFADVWEFEDMATARAAFDTWNGAWTLDRESEPAGWTRHPLTSRRRKGEKWALVRATEISLETLRSLREQVAAGAGHECDEWRLERGGQDLGRCLLCNKDLPPIGVELREATDAEQRMALADALRRRLRFIDTGGDAQHDVDVAIAKAKKGYVATEAGRAINFYQLGRRVGAAIVAHVSVFNSAGLTLKLALEDEHEKHADADLLLCERNAEGQPTAVALTAYGALRLAQATCDHEFADTVACVKCGWLPPAQIGTVPNV